jgi:hypothetical protein
VLEVAQRLGLSTAPPRGSSGGVIYTCPACSAERQHNGRRHVYQGGTGVGVRRDGLGWHCFACDVSGDAIALSCFKLAGGGKYKDLSRTTQQEVRAWWIDYLGNATTVDSEPAAAPASDPRASQPLYPPPNEIEEFKKQHCVRLDEHPQTLAWCSKHLVNATSVADQRLAIALAPRDPFPTFPAWAYCGKRTWLVLGYLVIVRLYDARGELRSYLARTVDAEPKGPAKSLGAQGFPRAGLVMACPLAQQMLRFGTHPSQWPAQSSGANVEPLRWPVEQPFRVMIAEGERDYLALASSAAAADVCRPAIMGIYSGSWTREIASRIPDGTRVILLRDDDAAGHKYARTIAETLAGRCDFRVRDGGSRG